MIKHAHIQMNTLMSHQICPSILWYSFFVITFYKHYIDRTWKQSQIHDKSQTKTNGNFSVRCNIAWINDPNESLKEPQH